MALVTAEELAAAETEEKKIREYVQIAMNVCDNRRLGIETPPQVLKTAYEEIVLGGNQSRNN